MLIIGCDFHPGFQQVAIFDNQTGRVAGTAAATPPRGGAVLRVVSGTGGAGGDGGLWALSVVRAATGGMGARVVAGRCGCDAGHGGAQAEDGPAGRGAVAAADVGRALSADLGAESGGAGRAAVAGASAQASAGADAGEESTAGHGVEPGSAAETETVDGSGAGGTGEVGVAALCEPTARSNCCRRWIRLEGEIRRCTGGWKRKFENGRRQ